MTNPSDNPAAKRSFLKRWLARYKTPAIILIVAIAVVAAGSTIAWRLLTPGAPNLAESPAASKPAGAPAPREQTPTSDLAVPSVRSFAYGYTKAWTTSAALPCSNVFAQTSSIWAVLTNQNDGDVCNQVTGLDASTGKTVWKTTLSDVDASCADGLVDGNIACITDKVELIDVETGSIVKTAPLEDFFPKSVLSSMCAMYSCDWWMFVADDSLVVSVDDMKHAVTSRISNGLKKIWTSKQYAASDSSSWTWASLVRLKSNILVSDYLDFQVALNFKTGAVIREGGTMDIFGTDTLASDGIISYFDLPDGGRSAVYIDSIVWFPSMTDTPPYPVAYALGMYGVSAMDPDNGKQLWKNPITAKINPGSSIGTFTGAYSDGVLILVDSDGNVYRVDPASGAVQWRSHYFGFVSRDSPDTGGTWPTATILSDGTVVVEDWGNSGSSFDTAFDPATGENVWTAQDNLGMGMTTNVQLAPLGPSLALLELTGAISRIDPAEPQPRVDSMPDSVASCPQGWAVSLWSSWANGNALVCRTAGKASYYVTLTDDSHTYIATDATRTPTGGYQANFPSGPSVLISMGGGLVQLTSSDGTITRVAPESWADGKSTGFTTAPASDIPSCASDTYPVSLSVWGDQWILTCGTSAGKVTNFSYYDGATTLTGKNMSGDSAKYCGKDDKGEKVCVTSSAVTLTSGKKTTAYPVTSGYTPQNGAVNAPVVTQVTSDDDARTKLSAEVLHDTSLAKASATNRWTPQLSAKWSGIAIGGTTWGNTEIWNEFTTIKAKHPTALLLKSTDWSTLGLSGHSWYTTVAGISFTDSADANRWCYTQGYTPENCFAVKLGHGPAKDTVRKWTPTDFGR